LLPVLQAFCRWGNRQFPETITPPGGFMKLRLGPAQAGRHGLPELSDSRNVRSTPARPV
jgi:hypothetical protein